MKVKNFNFYSKDFMMECPCKTENHTVWFFGGMFVGSFMSPLLSFFILIVFIFLSNKPLPDIFGGLKPQVLVNNLLKRFIPKGWSKIISDKSEEGETDCHISSRRIITAEQQPSENIQYITPQTVPSLIHPPTLVPTITRRR